MRNDSMTSRQRKTQDAEKSGVCICPEDLFFSLLHPVRHPKKLAPAHLVGGILLGFLVKLSCQETGGQGGRDLHFSSPGSLPAGWCVGSGPTAPPGWWSSPTTMIWLCFLCVLAPSLVPLSLRMGTVLHYCLPQGASLCIDCHFPLTLLNGPS